MGLFSDVGDWLSGATGANAAYAASKKLSTYQTKVLSPWSAQNMPTYQREGLEKAGYNPLLLNGGTSSYASGASVGAHQGDLSTMLEPLTALGGLASAFAAAKKSLAEANEADARTDAINTEKGSKTFLGKLFSDIQAWTGKIDKAVRTNSVSAKSARQMSATAARQVQKAASVFQRSSDSSRSSPAFDMQLKQKGGMTYDSYKMPSFLKKLGF